MDAAGRRRAIADALSRSPCPVAASVLGERFGVSRQIIVGDIALLRAAGLDMVATPRGYKLGETTGLIRAVACLHTAGQTEAELLTMVDHGCTVIDVVVDHPIYGQLTGQLSLASRYDVGQFVEKIRETVPLSALTGGVHLHHLRCPDEEAYRRVCQELDKLGVLYTQNGETGD